LGIDLRFIRKPNRRKDFWYLFYFFFHRFLAVNFPKKKQRTNFFLILSLVTHVPAEQKASIGAKKITL